jgi:phosphoglycolate phosphatase
MIGDSSNDVEAARRAGIDCIVVSYGYNHGESIYDCQPQQVLIVWRIGNEDQGEKNE